MIHRGAKPEDAIARAGTVTRDDQRAFLAGLAAATRPSEDLAAAVVSRTSELEQTQERLLHAERFAAMGAFARRLAHDLRNPLNVLQLNLQLLRKRLPEHPQLARPLERVEQALQQASAMVTDLLDFAHLDEPRLSPTRMESLLQLLMEETALPAGVTLRLEVAPDLPPVQADVEQLQQALRHLVTNALQAMQGRSGAVILAARREGNRVALCVSDEGCGIPAEIRHRLFDPLFTTRPRGTGLGLAVCRKIVENHGGEVRVESVAGAGSTFTLLLPTSARP